MHNVKRILTKPDHTLQQVVEAAGDMCQEEVLQVEINNWSRAMIIMNRIEEAYPHDRFMHECFKHKDKIWMYITTITRIKD